MAKQKSERPGYAKILDAWSQPEPAGDPAGCVATSFTFSPVFFETECLARFLGLESDAEDDRLQFLIEQENRMAQLDAACVLVDQKHCVGRRSLRWDLIPARVGPDRLMHAKVSVLVWKNCVRILIGSANLTEDGYRRNQEVFGVADFYEGSQSPRRLLSETTDFLQDVFRETVRDGSPAKERALGLLKRLKQAPVADWGVDEHGERGLPVRVFPVFSGIGKSNDVLDQVAKLWPPAGSPPSHAWVLSPFFDPPGKASDGNGPTRKLWPLLRKRGEAEITFTLAVEPIGASSDRVWIDAPESILRTERETARVRLEQIHSDGRPLHAKAIWLESDRHLLYLMGSSNFTMRGLGLAQVNNIEANLAYLVDFNKNKKEGSEFDGCWPSVEPLEPDQVQWRRAEDIRKEEEEVSEISPLPVAFGEAVFDSRDRKLRLRLQGIPPAGWELFDENTRTLGITAGEGQENYELEWTPEMPPTGLWVRWPEAGVTRKSWWPVEVLDPQNLLPPEELRDLPLDILVRVLTSAQPFHRALAAELRRRGEVRFAAGCEVIDPHKKVDVSAFLLQRSRRFAEAIEAVCERLAKPAPNHNALHWRIHGPVGVRSLVRAVQGEAKSSEERAFLLVELALALTWLKLPQAEDGMVKPSEVRKKIAEVIEQIRSELPRDGFESVPALGSYVKAALEEVTR